MRPEGAPRPAVPPPGGLELAPGVRIDPDKLDVSFIASAGPGGQNVNKRATRCQLRVALADLPVHDGIRARLAEIVPHLVTASGDVLIASGEHRSQERNRDECLERLRDALIAAMAPVKKRRKTKPTRGSKERRLNEKKRRGEIKRNRRAD